MADPIKWKKCEYLLNLDKSLDTFFNCSWNFLWWICEFNIKESRNGGLKMPDQKLNSNINLGEIWYLGVPDMTDLVHNSEIKNNN